MAELEPQTVPRAELGASDKAALVIRLDELLGKYLTSLDQYQRAQQQLTAHFTSGFLSLAKANFNNQSRTRYGQDYYDERMHASRKINLSVDESNVAFAVAAAEAAPKEQTGSAAKPATDSPKASPDGIPADSAPLSETEQVNNASTPIDYRDPLRWFGILVPPALRAAQCSFVAAVEGPVPQLATLVKDMRRQEADIARLRKQIRKL